MLKKVTLVNFQSHKNLELEFDKFTTLTGGSNSGKSAVLRAILALVRNDSAGDYLRYGQKTFSVQLDFSDGTSVKWVKGSGENRYVITSPEGVESVFDKVGSDVPDEVKTVLGLGPLVIKGSDKEYINFHSQLEAPFLISSTGGSVAKLFGELTSASQLYVAVGEGNKRVKSTNSLRSTRMEDVKEVREDLKAFTFLEDQVELVKDSEEKIKRATLIDQKRESIKRALEHFDSLTLELNNIRSTMSDTAHVEDVSLDALVFAEAEVVRLSNIVAEIDKYAELEKKGRATISYLEDVPSVDTEGLYLLDNSLRNLEGSILSISRVDESIHSLGTDIANVEGSISALEEELSTLLEGVDTCPTCFQVLTESVKESIALGGAHATH